MVPLSITYVTMLLAKLGRSARCAMPCEVPKIMSCVLGVRRPYGAVSRAGGTLFAGWIRWRAVSGKLAVQLRQSADR